MKTMNFFKKKEMTSISGIALFLIILLSSCEIEYYGHEGLPGRAYLSLNWENIEPDYLEVGNTEIPQTFYYGDYYKVHPGKYTLYYEVSYWDGNLKVNDAYETDYEIWINPGEPGGYHYDGRDGEDTYFSITLTPDGPGFYDDFQYKSSAVNDDKYNTADNSQNIKVMTKNNFTIKLTYKKVDPKKH